MLDLHCAPAGLFHVVRDDTFNLKYWTQGLNLIFHQLFIILLKIVDIICQLDRTEPQRE